MRPADSEIVQLFCHCYNLLHVDDISTEGRGALHRHMLPNIRHVALQQGWCIAPRHRMIMGIIPSAMLHCITRLRMIITPIAMLLRTNDQPAPHQGRWGAKKTYGSHA